MAGFRFRVEAVFDIRGRRGLVVAGVVLDGVARAGDALVDTATGRALRLLGIDMVCGRAGQITLVIDRADRDCATPGAVWAAADAAVGPA